MKTGTFSEMPAHAGFTLWFTGLPCSGKTTLSDAVEKQLRASGHRVEHLDGDVVRKNLSKDLGFSKEDRAANIDRVAFVASLLTRNGVATLVSFVSPYRQMRDAARGVIRPFIEVYVRCPLEVCEKRDVKGMYRLAREGKIPAFTGVSDPYEEPLNPEMVLDTDKMPLDECVQRVWSCVESRGLLIPRNPFPESERLSRAFELASRHHRGQTRKGGLPYITHPVAVAQLLKKAGYSDAVVAAGLLHDVLEDSGCEVEEIERKAGDDAAAIVRQVTDKDKTASWKERKAGYLRALETASDEALAVSCADKAHNLSSLAEGFRAEGDRFFKSFSGEIHDKIRNYDAIFQIIRRRSPGCRVLPAYEKALEEAHRFLKAIPTA